MRELSIDWRWTVHVIETAAAAGLDAGQLYDLAGLAPGVPPDEPRRVGAPRHLAVWALIMRALRQPGYPVRVAEAVSFDAYGVLGLACKTAATLGDALERCRRYLPAWTDLYELSVEPVGDRVRVRFERRGASELGGRAAAESAVAELVGAMRGISARPLRLVGVHFRHGAPEATAEHQRYFAAPLCFVSEYDGVEIALADLGSPVTLADEGLSRYLTAELEGLIQRAPPDSLEARVRRAVGDALPAGGAPRIEDVARSLGLTARTVQRRLAESRTSYRQVVEETREEVARQLLAETERPLTEVAFLLGFSEPSAFHRAFRRWSGHTPAHFRSRSRRASS